jgi:hypothetical protein
MDELTINVDTLRLGPARGESSPHRADPEQPAMDQPAAERAIAEGLHGRIPASLAPEVSSAVARAVTSALRR